MMTRLLAVIAFGTTFLLLAADQPKQKVEVSKTEHMDFPAGGTIRLTNSIGVVTAEAWDQPGVEITTIKSTQGEYAASERERATHQLDKVRIAAERRGEELVITTTFPRYRIFPLTYPLAGDANLNVEYRIKAPSTARLIVKHDVGEVNVDGLTGDMNLTVLQGQIMLHLPEKGPYDIHAKSDSGNVNSDFPGQKKRTWWLSQSAANEDSPAAHKLNLKVVFGDIVILKTRVPKPLLSKTSGAANDPQAR
jgi:putative adhesin